MIIRPKLTKTEMHIKWHNIKNRCYNRKWQDENGKKYIGATMSPEFLDKKQFFPWIERNWYVLPGVQMDIDHDIKFFGNKIYGKEECLVVPHFVNVFVENIPLGKTHISYNSRTNKYRLHLMDNNTDLFIDTDGVFDGLYDTYLEALDAYCNIKQMILFGMLEKIKRQIPKKVYDALINVDVKERNRDAYINVNNEAM